MTRTTQPRIDDEHRMRLLRFLLVKTAAVRAGVKPAELLRVRHCYEEVNAEGFRFCLYRRDVYETLGLRYTELRTEAASSLVLFHNPAVLAATLAERRNRAWLARLGYPSDPSGMVAELRRRCAGGALPHEVGVFIGYPLKDVVGFMRRLPATPLHDARGPWRVYGRAGESVARMARYAEAERRAAEALRAASDLPGFFAQLRTAA